MTNLEIDNKTLAVSLLAGFAIGGVLFWAENRRARIRAIVQGFQQRTQEYQTRFEQAMMYRTDVDLSAAAQLARRDCLAAIEQITAAVHNNIRWTSDRATSGLPENWQSPQKTVRTGQGDCEEFAMLELDWLERSGIRGFSVVIGAWGDEGHAWLEHEDGYFIDPTAGTIRSSRPYNYTPAVRLQASIPQYLA